MRVLLYFNLCLVLMTAFFHVSAPRGVLSRVDKEGQHLSVKHLLSLEGFCHGLTDCPDTELVQFVLDGICDGVWLGSLDGAVDADPWRCKNG